jgi:hypothetical protein
MNAVRHGPVQWKSHLYSGSQPIVRGCYQLSRPSNFVQAPGCITQSRVHGTQIPHRVKTAFIHVTKPVRKGSSCFIIQVVARIVGFDQLVEGRVLRTMEKAAYQ